MEGNEKRIKGKRRDERRKRRLIKGRYKEDR